MSMFSMERVHITALKKDRKRILELLQSLGTVEVCDTDDASGIFEKTDTSHARSVLLENAATAAAALEVLDKYGEYEKKSFEFLRMPTVVSAGEYENFATQKRDTALKDAQRIVFLSKLISEARAEILRIEAQEEMLVPWLGLPVPQTFSGTKKTAVFVGSIDGEHTAQAIADRLAEVDGSPPIHIELVSSSAELTCFYAVALKQDRETARETLGSIGFTTPASAGKLTPDEQKKNCAELKTQKNSAIKSAEEELTALTAKRDDIRRLEDDMTMRAEKYGAIDKLLQTKRVFILDGYIPAEDAGALEKALTSRFECAVEFNAVQDDDNAPVKLKNNSFSEPVEMVLESYSMPGRADVDPVNVMSIFYYVMFGLMFSDAGYGLILAGVCGALLLKVKDMKPEWRRNLKLFFWCGVSTIFWGIVFSSYFGDVVDVVSATFFGNKVSIPPLLFYPMEKPMLMLVFCLGIGLVHLSVAYIMKGVACAKNGDIPGILFDAVFPIGLVWPLIILLMGSETFLTLGGFMLSLTPAAVNICTGITLVCVFGILLTGGRESKNPVKRIMKGAYALYNTLAGWLSDVLSYSRLLALGLATGVIAGVMNQLGAMFGGGFFGMLAFIVVFCIGQSLNFGINVLGAYVHSNRLEYVEFLGKFYEGGGRKFTPFRMHTKYYKIKEETDNG